MGSIKVGAIWRFDQKETERRFGKTAGGITCLLSECGKFWYGAIDNERSVGKLGGTFLHESACDINKFQAGRWEIIRQAILDGTIGPPAEGKSPYSRKLEESCAVCRRIKDVGMKCWWCGNK